MEIPILETERLRLRGLGKHDLGDYADLHADAEVLRYLRSGPDPWDRARSWRHLAFLLGHWQLGGVGMWAVEEKETGAFLGVVGFAMPEGWPGFELAWILAKRWWGQGYATEAARKALDYAFDVLVVDRVISLIHPENRASIGVAERLGERLLERVQHLGGEMLCYGIDRETYIAAPRISHHPTEEDLKRFVRGDLSRPLVRSVVRHLLGCCPRCSEILRSFRHPFEADAREHGRAVGRLSRTLSVAVQA
jgi:RimJ/RimL family protein N-acetyltransferase